MDNDKLKTASSHRRIEMTTPNKAAAKLLLWAPHSAIKAMPCELVNLIAFATQRPGLDYGNYSNDQLYRAEARAIGRDLQHFGVALAAAVGARVTGENLREAGGRTFSGRLTFTKGGEVEYCTGQYWPTEYRKAATAVLNLAVRSRLIETS
jgi:hypothetical protein